MSITDELREWAHARFVGLLSSEWERELLAIADRIDEQHRKALEKVAAMVDGPDSSGYFDRIIATNSMPARIDALEKRIEAIERKLNHKGGAE